MCCLCTCVPRTGVRSFRPTAYNLTLHCLDYFLMPARLRDFACRARENPVHEGKPKATASASWTPCGVACYTSTSPLRLWSTAICQRQWRKPAIGVVLVASTIATPNAPIASSVTSQSIRVAGDAFSVAEKTNTDETAATSAVLPVHRPWEDPRRDNPRRQQYRSQSGRGRGRGPVDMSIFIG